MMATMMRIWKPKHERSCDHCQQKSNKATAHPWVKHDKHDKHQHNDYHHDHNNDDHRAGLSPSRVCGEILDFSLPVSRNFQRRSVTPASYISTIMMVMMMMMVTHHGDIFPPGGNVTGGNMLVGQDDDGDEDDD